MLGILPTSSGGVPGDRDPVDLLGETAEDRRAVVRVSVLNLAGREVAVLRQQDVQQGVSTLLWNGRSTSGTKAPVGRYLVRVTARGGDSNQSEALTSLPLNR